MQFFALFTPGSSAGTGAGLGPARVGGCIEGSGGDTGGSMVMLAEAAGITEPFFSTVIVAGISGRGVDGFLSFLLNTSSFLQFSQSSDHVECFLAHLRKRQGKIFPNMVLEFVSHFWKWS